MRFYGAFFGALVCSLIAAALLLFCGLWLLPISLPDLPFFGPGFTVDPIPVIIIFWVGVGFGWLAFGLWDRAGELGEYPDPEDFGEGGES